MRDITVIIPLVGLSYCGVGVWTARWHAVYQKLFSLFVSFARAPSGLELIFFLGSYHITLHLPRERQIDRSCVRTDVGSFPTYSRPLTNSLLRQQRTEVWFQYTRLQTVHCRCHGEAVRCVQ